MKTIHAALSALVLVLAVAGNAQAEVSQRNQQRAAQRAFEQSARDHQDVARGWQRWKDGAEKVRDGSVKALERLNRLRR